MINDEPMDAPRQAAVIEDAIIISGVVGSGNGRRTAIPASPPSKAQQQKCPSPRSVIPMKKVERRSTMSRSPSPVPGTVSLPPRTRILLAPQSFGRVVDTVRDDDLGGALLRPTGRRSGETQPPAPTYPPPARSRLSSPSSPSSPSSRMDGTSSLAFDAAKDADDRGQDEHVCDRPPGKDRDYDHDDAKNEEGERRLAAVEDRRHRLVIDDDPAAATRMCPDRVAEMAADGRLEGVTELAVFGCRVHARTISALLDRLPDLQSLALVDGGSDNYDAAALEDLEFILARVGALHSLVRLVVEFQYCMVNGSRLSFLRGLRGLVHLRLRGFDLSDGISHVGELRSLKSLHMCHGNTLSSPSNDADEGHLAKLAGMTELRHVHLEGFDRLSDVGLRPFCDLLSSVTSLVLRHCQELDEDCLSGCGRSRHLTSLHIVHGPCDDVTIFDAGGLRHLNALPHLKSLSLLHVLDDLSDLKVLRGLASLEYLNIAVEDGIRADDLRALCRSCVLPTFPLLRRLRIYTEDVESISRTCRCGRLDVEFASLDSLDESFL